MKNDQQSDARVAEIFNSCIAGFAISAAWELGVLDVVAKEGSLDISSFSAERDLHAATVTAIVDALACSGILRAPPESETVLPGDLFDKVFETKGFFHWLTRGSGHVFAE